MTAQQSNANRAKLVKTVADISTAGLSLVFSVAACNAGVVDGGVVAAVVALPLYHSVANLLLRYPDANTVVGKEHVDSTGLQAAGKTLRSAFTDAKAALALATIVGFVGLTVGALNDSIRNVVEEQRYDQQVSKLPALPLDTVVKAGTRASDLCINHHGQQIPYIYNALEYKVDCR